MDLSASRYTHRNFALASNFNRRSQRNRFPDFIHFLIRNGDAPVGPIGVMLQASQPPELRFHPVDHDVSASRLPEVFCAGPVLGVWVRDVKSQMKTAIGIPAIDDVMAFRRLVVAFMLLRIANTATQSNFVCLERLIRRVERHRMGGFDYDDLVDLLALIELRGGASVHTEGGRSKQEAKLAKLHRPLPVAARDEAGDPQQSAFGIGIGQVRNRLPGSGGVGAGRIHRVRNRAVAVEDRQNLGV